MRPRSALLPILLIICCWQALLAQRLSFEVASVKLNVSGTDGGSMGPRGDTLSATNVTLKTLLVYAYSPPNAPLLHTQIIGGPDWINTDGFDIQAKSESDGRTLPIEQTNARLQALLEDRFQLKAHREKRELPVYNLVLVKGGPKLSQNQTPPDPNQAFINFASPGKAQAPLPRGAMRLVAGSSSTTLTGSAIPISKLVILLQGQSDRMIVDKTGFSGLIDIQMEYSQDAGPDAAPLLFTAIQDLGLKLESAKSPFEVLVVDSVQKPSEN